ncbi:hypothetical protein [Algoriphagus sp.]|uniref:hypothetical protein n=1 Tax=Algoriphagus sp. TaxID=1872435 RepID=UPI0039187A95
MWKLIFILSAILLFLSPKKEESFYIIVDDCRNWRIGTPGKLQDQFSFYKQTENNRLIIIGHGWIEPSAKLSTEKIAISQIMEKKPIYTSTLDDEAWFRILQDSNRKLFILRPDDFCSGKRFVFNQEFTLYEAIISITRSE